MDKLLQLLSKNADLSNAQLAEMLGETETAVANARAAYEKSGVIRGYQALINWNLLQDEYLEAFIEVTITPKADQGFEGVAEIIAGFDEVESVYLMSGSFDLTVIISGRTLKEVATFVSERLSVIEGVTGTATHFILKKYKEKHALFTRQEEQTDRIAFV